MSPSRILPRLSVSPSSTTTPLGVGKIERYYDAGAAIWESGAARSVVYSCLQTNVPSPAWLVDQERLLSVSMPRSQSLGTTTTDPSRPRQIPYFIRKAVAIESPLPSGASQGIAFPDQMPPNDAAEALSPREVSLLMQPRPARRRAAQYAAIGLASAPRGFPGMRVGPGRARLGGRRRVACCYS